MHVVRIDEDQLNAACERFMRDVLASQVRELDAMGMGHIPYAVKARRCLGLYEESVGPPARRVGDQPVLRLVEQPTG